VVVAAGVAAEAPLLRAVQMSRTTLAMDQVEEASPAVAVVEALVDVISNGTRINPKQPRHNLRRRLRR
jgi:hypothetical protein